MKNTTYFLWTILLLQWCACTKNDHYQGDHFFVKNKGATMPVLIKGNLDANVFILFLHGGPGGNASQASFLPVFQELETDYALAYWDQRGSGLSQGNPDKSTFTLEQFVEDLNLVIEAIKERYDSPTIFLFGHSWGGALGAAYMSDTLFQQNIKGFINMDSGHNLLEGLPKSVVWLKNYADSMSILQPDDWEEISQWCATVPDMTVPENYFKYAGYIRKSEAFRLNTSEIEQAEIDASVIMNSYMSLAVFFNGGYLASNFNILTLNLSPQMKSIQRPTLVIWGKHDGINTLEMGFDAFNSIGDSSFTDKQLVVLEHSAHEGYAEEKLLFLAAFRAFIEQYK